MLFAPETDGCGYGILKNVGQTRLLPGREGGSNFRETTVRA